MTAPASSWRSQRPSLQDLLRENGIVVLFLGFVVFATAVSGGRFLNPSNVVNVLFQTSVLGVLALGETLVMLTGGIDLSIVATAILAAIVIGGAGSERQQEMSMSSIMPYLGLWPAVAAGIGGAGMVGLLNGMLVVALKIPAFIATLATSLLLAGLGMVLSGGAPIDYPDPFFDAFGQGKLLGVPYPAWTFFVIAIALGFALSRSAVGLALYGLGGNPRAARLSGIPVARITVLVYTLCGLLGGIGGSLFLARTGSVANDSGENLLLTTIAAVVVGGVSLAGGQGSIKNAVFGILLLAGLSNLMNILLVSPHLQDALSGVIILIAIAANARLVAR